MGDITKEALLAELKQRNKHRIRFWNLLRIVSCMPAVGALTLYGIASYLTKENVFALPTFALCFTAIGWVAAYLMFFKKYNAVKKDIKEGQLRAVSDTVLSKEASRGKYRLHLKELDKECFTFGREVTAEVYASVNEGDGVKIVYAMSDAVEPVTVYTEKTAWLGAEYVSDYSGSSALRNNVNSDGRLLITKDLILQDTRERREITYHSIFMILGVIFILLVAIFPNDPINRTISILFAFATIGTLFVWFLGARPVLKAIKKQKQLKETEIEVVLDTITGKDKQSWQDTKVYLVSFEDYNRRKDDDLRVYVSEYSKMVVGDKYYMLYARDTGEFIMYFDAKRYYSDGYVR